MTGGPACSGVRAISDISRSRPIVSAVGTTVHLANGLLDLLFGIGRFGIAALANRLLGATKLRSSISAFRFCSGSARVLFLVYRWRSVRAFRVEFCIVPDAETIATYRSR
jgi:hypothetical protein